MVGQYILGLLLCCLPLTEPPAKCLPAPDKPKNIILLIGDGMGLAHVALAELLGKPPTPVDRMEVVGLQKTHSASHLITDSGASATAMGCGVKTFNSGIGVNADSMPVPSILTIAHQHGLATGFVVTSSVVHATPAAFYAHVDSRGSYEEIARQLTESNVDVFVGGGEKYFFDRYSDDENLLRILREKDYEIVRSYQTGSMNKLGKISREKRIACFTAFEDPVRASDGRHYLPKMAGLVVDALEKRSDSGFFLMVEASQVDWASHANNPDWLAYEMQDAFDTMEVLLEKVKEDGNTLLIVTADHECGYLSIKGKRSPRLEFGSKQHTCQMVPVFATGPGAETFLGIYDNTEIFSKMSNLLGF